MLKYALALGTVVATGIVACASSSPENLGEAIGFAGTADASVAAGTLVLSQVYGGGGRAGASYSHDFAEILNRSSNDVTLDGLSLQLAADATSDFTIAIPLTGTIKAGGFYLVELGTNSSSSAAPDVPTPDMPATADTPQIGSNASGKIAIANVATALNCGHLGSTCPASKLVDLVGYGSTNSYEGGGAAPSPGTDTKKSVLRAGDGCTDTNDNSKDFALGDLTLDTVKPRSSSSATKTCTAPKSDAGADAGPKPPPINEPEPGPESPYDGGVRPDGGKAASSSGGASDGCAIGHVGLDGRAFSPVGLLAAVALFGVRRRRANRRR